MSTVPAATVAVPLGASRAERAALRVSAAIVRWATTRAARRAERRELMLRRLHEEQTRRTDPRAVDHALIALGLRPR